MALRSLHITGTFVEPIAEGTLVAKDLFLNLRRFHELYLRMAPSRWCRGRQDRSHRHRLCRRSRGDAAGCEPLSGTVDGDGRVQLNGRIEHSGLGGFMRPNWYQALDKVRSAIVLENVRHTVSGVCNVEVTTPAPGLQIVGNRDEMRVLGNVEVVSGRYMQDFDLVDRFLSARRVVEEEAPFWEGDPFLSGLMLGLNVRTRGTFRVLNNIADLRLATNDFRRQRPARKCGHGRRHPRRDRLLQHPRTAQRVPGPRRQSHRLFPPAPAGPRPRSSTYAAALASWTKTISSATSSWPYAARSKSCASTVCPRTI